MRQPARHLQRKLSSAQSSSIGCSAGTLGHGLLGPVLERFLEAVIPPIISHLFRLPFAKAAAGASLAPNTSQSRFPDGPRHPPTSLSAIIDPRRRCAGAGRAQPDLFLPRAARHGAEARRCRLRAARAARGGGRGLGGKRQSRSAPAQPPEGCRRKARCAAAEGGTARAGRLGRQLHAVGARHGAAHDACGWAKISGPSGCGSACGWSASRRSV